MKEIGWDSSYKLATIIDARIGECKTNVIRAFLDYRNMLPGDAVIVEGLHLIGGQVYGHAWIETPEYIIDPTIVCEENESLKETVKYDKVRELEENLVRKEYSEQTRTPGTRILVNIDYDDPDIQRRIRILEGFDFENH